MSDARLVESERLRSVEAARVAAVGALAATTMLFASLASAYLVRRSFADWRAAPALWPFALLACAVAASVGVERAERTEGRSGLAALSGGSGLYLVGALAVVFSIARERGLGSPHDAFVVLLLGVHAVHALVAMTFAARVLREGGTAALSLVRLVTHFLTFALFGILSILFILQ